VGSTYSSSGVSYTALSPGPVLFPVEANAAVPISGGVADCAPSEIITSKDVNNQSLAATAGATTDLARIDFTGCTRFHNCTYGHVTDETIGPRSLVVYFVAPS